MAPSSPCLNSRLHSTSGILACLDLNDNPKKAMEDMDLDKVIEIPDTPDQIAARASNYGEPVETGGSPSVHLGNSNYSDEGLVVRRRYRVRMGNENGHYRRLHFLPPKDPSDYSESEHHQSDCTGVQHIDKGKALCTEFASNSSVCQYNKAVININEQSRNDLVLQNGVLHDKLTNCTPKGICEGSFEGCGYFPMATNRPCKMMEVKKDYTCEGGNVDCREGTDFLEGSGYFPMATNRPCKMMDVTKGYTCEGGNVNCREGTGFVAKSQLEAEKSVSCTHSNILSRRVSGQKRLVRNGCISPHNIAKAKQVAGKIDNSSKNPECTDARTILMNGTPCVSGVNDLPPEDINANKVKLKGKGVLTHTSTPMEIPLSSRNPKNHKDEADRSGAGYNDVSDSLQGLNGWISTRNRTKKIHHPCSDGPQGHIRRKDTCIAAINRNTVEEGPNGSGINSTASDYTEVQNVDSFLIGTVQSSEMVSRLVSESDKVNNVRQRAAKALIKRQRKQASASSHPGQCSTSVSSNAGIVCLDSPGESSNSISKGPRRQGLRHRHAVHPIIEIDESPFETRQCVSQHVGCCDNDSDARARQLEADERLARELQEQLYHESPVFNGAEVDAHVAWALQQEEATHARSTRSHRNSLPRGSLASHTRSNSRSDRSNLIRRENHTRNFTSNRMTQLRRRIQNQLPAAMSGERFSFPASMNLEARLNVLEALEASAIGNTGRVTNILRVQRDFNENDYEMLLTLDENNDNHSGASINLINSLPQTVVQTASFEEACAICLETPTTGDSIRHLPCLHKFHKDCIDPWLSRKTSCPVCKSSIR